MYMLMLTFAVVFRDLMPEAESWVDSMLIKLIMHALLPSFICHYQYLEISGMSP